MEDRFSRTALLLGEAGLARLRAARVAVVGLGGVGSFVAEALVRAGVGRLLLMDGDTIAPSNLNRQLHATTRTIGRPKAEAMRERMLEIAPEAGIEAVFAFYEPSRAESFFAERLDYLVDSVDDVSAKLSLAEEATRRGVPIISSMGAAGKLDPTRFEVADIYETSVCPLARVMRRELKKRGVPHLRVVYSREEPIRARDADVPSASGGRAVPGSVSFVPSVAGLILAGEVVRELSGVKLS